MQGKGYRLFLLISLLIFIAGFLTVAVTAMAAAPDQVSTLAATQATEATQVIPHTGNDSSAGSFTSTYLLFIIIVIAMVTLLIGFAARGGNRTI